MSEKDWITSIMEECTGEQEDALKTLKRETDGKSESDKTRQGDGTLTPEI